MSVGGPCYLPWIIPQSNTTPSLLSLHTSTSFSSITSFLLTTQQHPDNLVSTERHPSLPFPASTAPRIPLVSLDLFFSGNCDRWGSRRGGKWIKSVLFGKISSKSGLSKKFGTEKESTIAFNASAEISAPQSAIPSNERNYATRKVEDNMEIVKENIASVQPNAVSVMKSLAGDEREGKAASLVQATFRGYLARRAFRVLKGIIRLQALIRGHLVRRQAISTLCCMQTIVDLQRMIRGQRLLVSSPSAVPLNLHYDPADPNCTENWLERWSSAHFWEALPQTRKVVGSRFQKQQNGVQHGEVEPARSKRVVRKSPMNAADCSSSPASDMEKPIRGPRKGSGNKPDPMQEHAQIELERDKRNLRKVTAASKESSASEGLEGVVEKPKVNPTETVLAASDEPVKGTGDFSEVINMQRMSIVEDTLLVGAQSLAKSSPAVEMPDSVPENSILIEINSSGFDQKAEEVPAVEEEQTPKDDNSGKVVHKTKRRMSLPAKEELSENVSVNTSNLPSYMAATESAKAKLKGHGLVRFSQDGAENGFVRRHSLPSSANGKLNSTSPHVQRPVQVNSKAGGRTDRVLSSKDNSEKPGWRR